MYAKRRINVNHPIPATLKPHKVESRVVKLYYHKTSGGAEYLFDTFVKCPNGRKEGAIRDNTKYVVRIDGDITKDAELTIR